MVNMVKKNKLITAVNFRDFDWNKAKLFYHLAKCGGFTKAAHLAGIDQSVLTRQIQTLEIQVGSRLVTRTPKGITLTRKGEELLEKVAPFFLEMRGFCGNAHVEVKGEKKRKIRITTSHALATHLINDALIEYNKNNPHLILEIMGDDDMLDIILNDVDIVIRPYDSQSQGVQQELLFTLEKKLFASKEYLDKHGEPQTVDDLINHHIIAFAQPGIDHYYSNVNWILTLGMPEGKLHRPVYTSNSIECLIKAAQKGVGIIGSYEEYEIIKNSNLINILPSVKDKPLKEYFVYPDYLKEDEVINDIKNYLQKEGVLTNK